MWWSAALRLFGLLEVGSTWLPLGRQSQAVTVQEVHGFLNPETFFQEHVIPGAPVVFRGAARTFPAFSKWSDEYFLSLPESKHWKVAYELGKKETRKGGQWPIPFSDYIKRYKVEDLYCVTGFPKFLRHDVPIYESLNCPFVLENLMDDLVMWFSNGGTRSVWHYDDYENINCLIKGRKELILADRKNVTLGHFLEGHSHSLVDVEAVNLDTYPGFGGMTFYNATLEEGDCVYIPTFWAHTVTSWGRNIAINAWWEIYKTPFSCTPLPNTSPSYTTWRDVKLLTDSDIGSDENSVMVDPNDTRKLSANFRAVMYASVEMLERGVLSRDQVMAVWREFSKEDEMPGEEYWGSLFDVLDADGDGSLHPREIDVVASDEILFALYDRVETDRQITKQEL